MEEGLPVNCALWLNKRKVFSASEIHENLDVASLRGYFLAGSLLEWLRSNGGEQYAEALFRVSPDDENLNDRIADIFGGKPLPVKTFGENFPAEQATAAEPNGIVPSSCRRSGSSGSFCQSCKRVPPAAFHSGNSCCQGSQITVRLRLLVSAAFSVSMSGNGSGFIACFTAVTAHLRSRVSVRFGKVGSRFSEAFRL